VTERGAWDQIAELIDDEVLHTFAVIGTPEAAVVELQRRYDDLATRITLSIPASAQPERWGRAFAAPRGSGASD
jgi:hypothetical protein